MKTVTLILCIFFLVASVFAADPLNRPIQTTLNKSALQEWKFFDINNINCTINSAGPYADYLRTNSPGLTWPKWTIKSAVYTSGLWVIGIHRPTGKLRTAVQQYSTEFQPGIIENTFNTTTNSISALSDPIDKRYRIYKLNRMIEMERNLDYAEWPGDLGAPYIDKNNNGKWDKGIDIPKITGEQTMWCVYNDGNTAAHAATGRTYPMGIEVHAMYYGFTAPHPLDNTMYIKWKIINKSDSHYDSTFIGLFSDFDLGDYKDDLDGYDSTLQLAYVYNGDDEDDSFSGYGSQPPACGTVFLGGNRGLSAYAYPLWINKDTSYSDPPLGTESYSSIAFNYLRGLKNDGTINIDPTTNAPARFAFTGDPITNTGWTRLKAGFNPGDVRSLLSLGPVTLAPGDTQEVNAAFVIAQGSDRLASLKKLREDVAIVRVLYDSDFKLPQNISTIAVAHDSIMLRITADGTALTAKSISVDIISEQNNTLLATTQLLDDGTNGDETAMDGIFSRTLVFAASPEAVRINASIVDYDDRVMQWNGFASHIPLYKLSLGKPEIYSDDLNKDGLVNPGEDIRYGIKLHNPHPFTHQWISITAPYTSTVARLHIDSVKPSGITGRPYDPSDRNSYISLFIPKDVSGNSITHHLTLYDEAGSSWSDSVTFTVEQPLMRYSSPARSSGRARFDFKVIVTDKKAVKNHWYILRGTDSGYSSPGFQLKDSTENRIIIPYLNLAKLYENIQPNHEIPVTDGFKIYISRFENYPIVNQFYIPYENRWSNPNVYFDFYDYAPRSSVHHADIPNAIIKYSKRTSFIDQNADGILNGTEFYSFDSTNNLRTQKGYLYTAANKYLGFVTLPFAAYSLSNGKEQKLSVVLYRQDSIDTSLRYILSSDRVYIMAAPYDPSGKTFDSTKGGMNLLPQFNTTGTLPYYFYFKHSKNGYDALKDTVDFVVEYTPKFSSRDIFLFNPTEIQIENIQLPADPVLYQNYPNPFNPATTIRYSVPKQSNVSVIIYNILGQHVRTLLNDIRNAGTYEIDWNGRDDNGNLLASGVYIFRFSSESAHITKKMLLLK